MLCYFFLLFLDYLRNLIYSTNLLFLLMVFMVVVDTYLFLIFL